MNISITPTGITVAGPAEITSVEITDHNDVTQTLNMALVNSTGTDDIVAGTNYELSLSGFWNNANAFVDPNIVEAMIVSPLNVVNLQYLNTQNIVWDGYLNIGNTDTYGIKISDTILRSDLITDYNVTANTDNLLVNSISKDDNNIISVALTGVTSGYHPVHFEYTTETGRSDCVEVMVYVDNNC